MKIPIRNVWGWATKAIKVVKSLKELQGEKKEAPAPNPESKQRR